MSKKYGEMTTGIMIIGEDYVFERPQNDYLPNQVIHLKAKNRLRNEQRARSKGRGL